MRTAARGSIRLRAAGNVIRSRALRISLAWLILSSSIHAQEIPPDPIAQRARPCTACHGEQGRATREGYFPRIAGKPAAYLFNQPTGFRDGRRFFPEMTFLVERQRDE